MIPSKILLWAGAIAGSGIVLVIGSTAPKIAKPPAEIGDIAKSIVVSIGRPTDYAAYRFGSGVIVGHQDDNYTVLTTAQIVKNSHDYRITTSDNRTYESDRNSITTTPGNIDLAIVKFRSTTNYPTAKLGNSSSITSGTNIYVAGFINFGRNSKKSPTTPLVFQEGRVLANSHQSVEAGYSFIYTNNLKSIVNGAAILNDNGELVAIHGISNQKMLVFQAFNFSGSFSEQPPEQYPPLDYGLSRRFDAAIAIDRFTSGGANIAVDLGKRVFSMLTTTTLTADDYIAAAIQKYAKQDERGAVADLDRAIQLQPDRSILYNYRGVLKAGKLKDPQGGLADFNRAIELDPNDISAYRNRGNLKARAFQDPQGGLADLDRAIQLDPNDGDSYSSRAGVKHLSLKDRSSAIADLGKSLELFQKQVDIDACREILVVISVLEKDIKNSKPEVTGK